MKHSRKIMYYFTPDKLPVLTTLAPNSRCSTGGSPRFPGRHSATGRSPITARRSATSAWSCFYANARFKSIYQRLATAGHTAKIYYFDRSSSTLEVVNLLQHQPQLFGTYPAVPRRLQRGHAARLLRSSSRTTAITRATAATSIASDQHPDHHVQEGERFIAVDLQRDPAESGPVGDHRAADRV